MNDDLVLRALHLCSGYGGFELGLRLAGIQSRTVCHVERDAHAAATLVARMEDQALDSAPIWSDLATFDGGAWRGRVDLVTAGFPCQPFSTAGQQRGVEDPRWLWPRIAQIVGEVGPRYVFLENVPQLVKLGLPHVLDDLAQLGFDAEWGLLAAADVGAPHRRSRLWLLAYSADGRLQGGHLPTIPGWSAHSVDPRARPFPPSPGDADAWHGWLGAGRPEPTVLRGPDGRPPELADALHLGGNGLVPRVAAAAFRQLLGRLNDD